MDCQTTYNEAMEKLAEAQKCQDEIAGCNQELRQVNEAIIEMSKVIYNNVCKTRLYLYSRQTTLNEQKNNLARERDEKLNEALSKALDLADDETNMGIRPNNSFGVQAATAILVYIGQYKIPWQSSIAIKLKGTKLIVKGVTFFDIQKAYCWLWQSVFSNGYCCFRK